MTCEEGTSDNFGGDPSKTPNPKFRERYGYDGSDYNGYARFHKSFQLDQEPNESNRFDWVVEIDPHDPASNPVKQTAMGRMAPEGATCVLNSDG